MSIHSSLSSVVKGKKQRTVLKRTERIKHLIDKEKWLEESKVYGLPKIKIARLKVKKEKAAEKPKEETAIATEAKTAPTEKEKPKNQ